MIKTLLDEMRAHALFHHFFLSTCVRLHVPTDNILCMSFVHNTGCVVYSHDWWEHSQAVTRNPLLLALRPEGFGQASGIGPDTIVYSYVIAITRPIGPVLLYGTIFLVCYPFIKNFYLAAAALQASTSGVK